MNQYRYSEPYRKNSSSGCARFALIGGGCAAVLVIAAVGIFLAAGLFWERGTEAGSNWVSGWISDQIGSDISDRVDAVEQVSTDLPEAQEFHDRESYLEFLDAFHREFVSSMERMAELVSSPEFQNDQWSDDIAQEIALIRHLESEAQSVTPPDDLETAHNHWVTGMGEYRRAIDTTASALDNASISGLGEGVGALSSATQSYIQLAKSLNDQGVLDELQSIEELDDAFPDQ